jgi:hypothetical protein
MSEMNTVSLLKAYYSIQDVDQIPKQRVKSLWKAQNKFGFLCGIVRHGEGKHVRELEKALSSGEFQSNKEELIERLYERYIQPFKQHNGSRCSTLTCSSTTSTNGDKLLEEVARELRHKDLKKAVWEHDTACLSCWDTIQCEAAHIITQKNNVLLSLNEMSLFQQAGIREKHQVQNGHLLCVKCHIEFDALKRYIDIVEERFILKVVNSSNDDQSAEWKWVVRNIKVLHQAQVEDWAGIDNREAVRVDGEMEILFASNDVSIQPNHIA